MADSLVRLRIDSNEFDAKLKTASQNLQSYFDKVKQGAGTFEYLDDGVLDCAKALGQLSTKSNTAKGSISELTSSFTEWTLRYKQMTDAEKNTPLGREIKNSLDQLKTRIQDTKKELSGIDSSLNGGKGAFNQLFSGVAGKFGMSPQMFTGVGAAIAGVGMAAKLAGDNIRTAFNFERSISGLSALTGMVGKDLEKLKNNAIELGSTTTLTASQVADAFRLIGSQQPQLLADAEALKEVTKYAIRLSEAAGIDLVTASQTLSTSINQMGGDSANAARYVNVLAAASQKGAGDISWLGEAITKAATAAKAVGTDYEELVANLEQLAKAGFDASTAGTALRSIIMNLEKQANNEFKPSVVGLTQAFENLGKAQLDITGYQNIAGKMFATQAKVLSEAAGAAKEMEKAITGTNIAEEQAQTNTANLDGSLKALASAWEGLNLHINDSNGFLKSCVDWLKETVQWMDNTFTAAGRAKKALDDLRGGGEDGKGRKIDTRTEYEVKEVKSAMQGEGDAAKVKQQQILDKYDRDIAAKQKELDRASAQVANAAKSGNYTSVATARNIEERLRDEVEALKTLKQEFKSVSDDIISPKQVTKTPNIIESAEESVSITSGNKVKSPTVKSNDLNPIQQAQKEISALTEEALTADEGRLEVIKKEIAALQQQVAYYKEIEQIVTGKIPELNTRVGVIPEEIAKNTQPAKPVLPTLDDYRIQAMIEIDTQNTKVDTNTLQTLLQDAIQQGIDVTSLNLEPIAEQIGKGINVPDSAWEGIMDGYKELCEEIGADPIKIDLKTGNKAGSEVKDMKADWKDAAGAVQSLGSALQSIEDPAAKVVGIIAQAIATVALTFSKSLAGTITPWDWIAAAAAGTATMISTIAAIKSATAGSYEQGGIIPGNSYTGDRLTANVNSGELILSMAQQDAVANRLTDNEGNGGVTSLPYVTGEKIVLGVNNWGRATGRGQLVFAKN